MKSFIGTYINKIDAKGRISVPAPFRMVVQAKGLTEIVLYPSPMNPCIEGCGVDRIEELIANIPNVPFPDLDEDASAHLIIGNARHTPFDGGGRIILPEDFLAEAGLTDKGAFVGLGHTFQIWEPAALESTKAAQKQRLMAKRRAQLDGPGS